MIPPIYAETTLNFFTKSDRRYHYFQSARESLVFLLLGLEIDVLLIPSYTCPSVLESLKSVDIDYDFVDLDEDLDFSIEDLEFLIDFYSAKKIALLATSLFNACIRDYKRLYPNLLVIEDLTQSLPVYKQSGDFAIYSFGKSKFLSAFGGGMLEGIVQDDMYKKLPYKCSLFTDYILSVVSQTVLRYGWNSLYMCYEKQKQKEYVFHKIEPKRICDIKSRWINGLLKSSNLSHRERISTKYIESIDSSMQFSIPSGKAYLRIPVKRE